MNRTYRFLGTAIAVDSDEPSILDWLDEFLAPAFEVLPVTAAADFRVTIRADPSASEAIAATRPYGPLARRACFALDQEVVALPHWATSDAIVLDAARFGALYVIAKERAEVDRLPGAPQSRGGAMRLIREVASVNALRNPNRLLLHAAALENRGRAVLIAGPKGSGKTTVLAYLTAASGARILTNDRSLLCCGVTEIEVRGIPTFVSIREGPLDLLSLRRLSSLWQVPSPSRYTLAELAAHAAKPRDVPPGRLRLSPAQLAHVAGVSLSPSGRLSAIAFPEIRTGERSLRLKRLSAGEAHRRLREARFGIASAKSSSTVFEEMFGVERYSSEEEVRLAMLSERVPCFGIAVGDGAYSDKGPGIDLVERLTHEVCR